MILTDENGKKYKVKRDSWVTDELIVEPIEEKPKFVRKGIVHVRGDWSRLVAYDNNQVKLDNIKWRMLARTIANFKPKAKWVALNHGRNPGNSVLSFWGERPYFSDDIWYGSHSYGTITINYAPENAYSECVIEIERI